MMKDGSLLSELLFPANLRCIVCGGELDRDTRYGVCDKCKLPYNTKFCLRCGRGMKNMAEYCDRCQNESVPFDFARAPFIYEGDIIKVVRRLKFGSGKYLAPFMAERLADIVMEEGITADYITYVPLSEKRLHERGYDQAREIAAELSRLTGIPLVRALKKVKDTGPLAKMGRKERQAMVEGAYEVTEVTAVRKKNFILVDDVFTSGSTSGECAKVLKEKKARKVVVLTFATSKIRPELY